MLFKAFHRRIPLEDRTIKSWLLPHLLCIHSAIVDWYLPQTVIICERTFSLDDFSPLKLTQTHFKNEWMSRNWRITLCVFGYIPYCACDFETKTRAGLISQWFERNGSLQYFKGLTSDVHENQGRTVRDRFCGYYVAFSLRFIIWGQATACLPRNCLGLWIKSNTFWAILHYNSPALGLFIHKYSAGSYDSPAF